MATKQRKQQKTDQLSPIESMREIFDDSQRLVKHQTCLHRMIDLQIMYSKTNQSITNFYKELIRNIKYTLWVQDWRSPYGQNSIGFIIKYLLKFGQNGEEDNEELRNEFIDTVLEDVIIPYTNSKKAECRINACHFIRRLAEELEDINDDIFNEIRKALLDRSVDRISSVRAAAILALHRFQDVLNDNDLVMQAIHFHLNHDPDHDVRHNCLKAMASNKVSLVHFIAATRDVKDFIRKTAYLQISDKLNMRCFTIEDRLIILKNGLKDRSPAVRKVVESVLIPSWVKFCKNDLIELLIALDIQTDLPLIEKMLEIYFKHLNKEKVSEDSNKTKFHQLVDEFREKNLGKENVFKVSLNVENVFLWQYLCEFCKTNQIECQESITEEKTEPNVSEVQTEELMDGITVDNQNIEEEAVAQPLIQKVDLFDLLVPDVPYFCEYLEKFLNNVIKEELNIADALDFEFIFNQFMKVSLLLDIEDNAQREILIKSMHSLLMDTKIGDKFHNYISPIMKSLAKKGFTDNNSYLDFTVEIISEIFASIQSPIADENETINNESNRELEVKKDRLMADIEKSKTNAKELENEEKLSEAEELYKQIEALELEVKSLKARITIHTLSQSSQTTQTPNPISFTDNPKAQMRCLHIFSGCLEFGVFDEVNVVMQTHIEKVCIPGILSDNPKIRCVATRCLGLVCLTSPQYFKKYLHLLIEIFCKDIESTKLIALKSIFDSLCEHGINIFEEKGSTDSQSGGGDGPQVGPFEDKDEDFITSLKQFFLTQLDSEINEFRQTAAQGVSKLLIHCRMYSPELLSKLIIIWFTPNENQEIIQFIGDFLRLYSLAESQGVIVGQSALEEAFVITLQTIYNHNLRLNSENLIKFFLKLIADENHVKLAEDLVKRILEVLETDSKQTKLVEDYLLSAVSQLNLIEMEAKDLKRFEENICKIEEKLENSKSKRVKQKLSTIKKNIENKSQQLSADSAFADDFRSVDDNNDEQHVGSDSDEDSFRTCPESPLQKRRRLSENCNRNESLTQNIVSEIVSNDIEVNVIQNNESLEPLSQPLDRNTDQIIASESEMAANEDIAIDLDLTQNNETIEEFSQSLDRINITSISSPMSSADNNDMNSGQNHQTIEGLSESLEKDIDEIIGLGIDDNIDIELNITNNETIESFGQSLNTNTDAIIEIIGDQQIDETLI